ncbi:MAG TPA: CoA transferase [Ktedonobacterales bacterium]|nr:CoA transferase [Ktedonobacterales bacterium]
MRAADATLADLWCLGGLADQPPGTLTLTGADPALPSSFAVGTAAQVSIAAVAGAANAIWQARTGRAQQVSVDMHHAAAEFRSERYLRVDGGPPPEIWDKIAGLYRCGDGRWVRLHTNFPQHREGVLRLLGCAYDRAAVAAALQRWQAEPFEAAAADAGLCVTMLRSFAEWDAHPQAHAVASLPVLILRRIGDAPPRPFAPDARRPLGGVRVLDLTRVIAGPVCCRALAAHGADVLLVGAAHLPSIATAVMDTGRGKRAAFVDLRAPAGRARLTALLGEADIFVQAYRPGALAGLGFGPDAVAALRPGIVYVSVSAYGHLGPWAGRRGFDSLVQTASGLNDAEAAAAGAGEPLPLPCQALDHAAGYLAAFGALAARLRQAHEGGSWHVQVSLAQTGHWLRGLGRVERGFACPDPTLEDVADLLEERPSGFGRLLAVRHAARMSETPPRWDLPSVPLGTDAPVWDAAE